MGAEVTPRSWRSHCHTGDAGITEAAPAARAYQGAIDPVAGARPRALDAAREAERHPPRRCPWCNAPRVVGSAEGSRGALFEVPAAIAQEVGRLCVALESTRVRRRRADHAGLVAVDPEDARGPADADHFVDGAIGQGLTAEAPEVVVGVCWDFESGLHADRPPRRAVVRHTGLRRRGAGFERGDAREQRAGGVARAVGLDGVGDGAELRAREGGAAHGDLEPGVAVGAHRGEALVEREFEAPVGDADGAGHDVAEACGADATVSVIAPQGSADHACWIGDGATAIFEVAAVDERRHRGDTVGADDVADGERDPGADERGERRDEGPTAGGGHGAATIPRGEVTARGWIQRARRARTVA